MDATYLFLTTELRRLLVFSHSKILNKSIYKGPSILFSFTSSLSKKQD
jgi:hypothetical protein